MPMELVDTNNLLVDLACIKTTVLETDRKAHVFVESFTGAFVGDGFDEDAFNLIDRLKELVNAIETLENKVRFKIAEELEIKVEDFDSLQDNEEDPLELTGFNPNEHFIDEGDYDQTSIESTLKESFTSDQQEQEDVVSKIKVIPKERRRRKQIFSSLKDSSDSLNWSNLVDKNIIDHEEDQSDHSSHLVLTSRILKVSLTRMTNKELESHKVHKRSSRHKKTVIRGSDSYKRDKCKINLSRRGHPSKSSSSNWSGKKSTITNTQDNNKDTKDEVSSQYSESDKDDNDYEPELDDESSSEENEEFTLLGGTEAKSSKVCPLFKTCCICRQEVHSEIYNIHYINCYKKNKQKNMSSSPSSIQTVNIKSLKREPKDSYKSHIKNQIQYKECRICHHKLRSENYYKHYRSCCEKKRREGLPVVCSICNKVFKSQYILQMHMKLHTVGTTKSFSCTECSKSFAFKKYLENHFNRIHSNTKKTIIKCPQCPKEFTYKNSLTYHIENMHKTPQMKKCPHCKIEKAFRYFRSHKWLCLKRIERGTGPWICSDPLCNNREFQQYWAFHAHIKSGTHSPPSDKDKPKPRKGRKYKQRELNLKTCSSCGITKSFLNLENHLRHCIKRIQEKGPGPWVCPECNMLFSQFPCYKSHVKLHETKNANVRYKCSKCDSSFIRESYLKTHMTVHSEERNLLCTMCPASFKWKFSLTKHIKSQHTENPEKFQCHLCGMMLSNKEGVKKHIRGVHEGIRKFKCDSLNCDKSFKERKHLEYHINCTHNNPKPNGKKRGLNKPKE